MSNNSSTSLMAKNISSYATIGSAFLGGLVGFFIGKSMGPDEEEQSTVEEASVVQEEPSSSSLNVLSSLDNKEEPEVKIESEQEQVFPNLSQVEEPLATSMQVVPVSETSKEAQQVVLNPEPEVAPVITPIEPLISQEKVTTPAPPPAPTGIQGGKTKTRRSRKHHKRSSRKYIGGQPVPIVPPS
jgi:hypothetical protein